jgi:hypothetical protein
VVVFVALFVAACSSGNVWSLEVGDCFDDWEGATTNSESEEITDVPIVECSEPHDNEIYMMEDLPEGAFPGDAAMEETAIGVCYDGFEDFVGTEYEESDLDFGWLFPTSESWGEGDREVICFVYDLELAKLTGSMANAGI